MRKPLPLLGKLIFDLSRCHQRVYIAGASPAGPKSLRAKGLRQFQPRIRFFIGIFPPSQLSHWFFSPLGIRGILSRPSPHDAAHFWSVPAIQYDLPCFRSRERQGFQPSTAHWTILLTEIVPEPRAYLGGFPDSISFVLTATVPLYVAKGNCT